MNTMTKQQERRPEAQAPVRSELQYVAPRVDIVETNEAYILEAEMSGVTKEGLEILLEGNELTIVGHRNDAKMDGQCQYMHRETRPIGYRRVFELDPAVDRQKIDAKMDQGVLTLTLPKSEQVKPRRITVTD